MMSHGTKEYSGVRMKDGFKGIMAERAIPSDFFMLWELPLGAVS